MKRLFTLAALALFLQVAHAQKALSVLNLRISDNAPFRVVLDGREEGRPGAVTHQYHLRPGKHYMEVYRSGKRGYHMPLFAGTIVLAPNTESFVTVLPQYGKVKFDHVQAIHQPQLPTDIYYQEPCTYPVAPVTGPGQCGTPAGNFGPVPMNTPDFAQMKQTINNAGFESTRLTILKQALNYNHFTTQQVCELMDLFWFESSKLEVAKLTYPKTTDPQNYYLVNNSFSFSSSVNQLSDYIAMQ